MKKLILITTLNLIIIFFIFLIFDYILLVKNHYNVSLDSYEPLDFNLPNRVEQNLPFNKNLNSIITIGCSFVYGSEIEQEETFAYQLQKGTKRKVYNLGIPTTGLQHVLLQIKKSNFFNQGKITPAPEYIIYVFISDHARRLYANYFELFNSEKYLRYINKGDNKLIEKPKKIVPLDYLKVTYLAKKFNHYMYSKKSSDEIFDFIALHLIEAKKSLNEKYPETKFVILIYNNQLDTHRSKPYYTNRWSELEKEGFIIIDLNTKELDFLTENEYISGAHPAGSAWQKIIPIVRRRLNI